MAGKNGEIIRLPVGVDPQSRRRLDERIYVRFPKVAAFVGQALFRLPPRSRLRQAMIRRSVKVGIEALNRGDFKSAFSSYAPEAEMIPDAGMMSVGIESVYRGLDERIRLQQRWVSDWGGIQFARRGL